MDFAKLDLRTTAEQEHWLHLRAGDHYLYNDEAETEPCRVRVASVAKPEVEKALTAAERGVQAVTALRHDLARANRQQRAEIEPRLDAAEKRAAELQSAFLVAAIVDWENIEVGEEPAKFTKAALADLCEPKAPFFRLAGEIMEDMAKLASPFA
jgi:hypothetical protein